MIFVCPAHARVTSTTAWIGVRAPEMALSRNDCLEVRLGFLTNDDVLIAQANHNMPSKKNAFDMGGLRTALSDVPSGTVGFGDYNPYTKAPPIPKEISPTSEPLLGFLPHNTNVVQVMKAMVSYHH